MALHRSLIAILARRNPSIWEEIIGPHGPLSRFDAVALNPQPLPPNGILNFVAVARATGVAPPAAGQETGL